MRNIPTKAGAIAIVILLAAASPGRAAITELGPYKLGDPVEPFLKQYQEQSSSKTRTNDAMRNSGATGAFDVPTFGTIRLQKLNTGYVISIGDDTIYGSCETPSRIYAISRTVKLSKGRTIPEITKALQDAYGKFVSVQTDDWSWAVFWGLSVAPTKSGILDFSYKSPTLPNGRSSYIRQEAPGFPGLRADINYPRSVRLSLSSAELKSAEERCTDAAVLKEFQVDNPPLDFKKN